MGKRRTSDIRAKRGVGFLIEAIKSGRIIDGDEDGAADVLAECVPGVGRQTRHAQLLLARNCMAALPEHIHPPQLDSVPRAPPDLLVTSATPPPPTSNSNLLLPSIRPRPLPTPTPPARRKRARRVRPSSGAGTGDGRDTTTTTVDAAAERSFLQSRPSIRLSNMGGIDPIISTVRELTVWPLFHSEAYSHLGVLPPRGILLHGPPGCGKTMLANALAGELGVSFLSISGPEIVSSMSGESERKLRSLFNEARAKAPSIIFIDEIDVIAAKKEGASKDMERRIVSQLISCIDQSAISNDDKGVQNTTTPPSIPPTDNSNTADKDAANNIINLESPNKYEVVGMEDGVDGDSEMQNIVMDAENEDSEDGNGLGNTIQVLNGDTEAVGSDEKNNNSSSNTTMCAPFIVIAATNRPESIEPALRRAGRFDREIELGAPDESGRVAILRKLCGKLNLADRVDFESLGKRTAGCVGADLDSLVRESAMAAIRRFSSSKKTDYEKQLSIPKPFTSTELVDCSITMQDFAVALDTIQPSALREGFATRPDVTWNDIGALEEIRKELSMAIVEPVKNREMFEKLGLSAPAGVLLYGPPGCGKTLLARAIAAESGANFISVKGPELLSKYVGDSELAIRKVFTRAKSSAPSVIFFDELDALAPRRGRDGGSSSSGGATERVVNMLLTEMDGFGKRRDVFLVAATNRPDIIDPAMLRPGRLDKLLYIGLPTPNERVSILQKLGNKMLIDTDEVDLETIAKDKRCAGFSGADLNALLRAAAEQALRVQIEQNTICSEMKGISKSDFEHALNCVLPSVSMRDAKLYCSMESKLRKSRAHLAAKEEESEKKNDNIT